MDRYRSGGGGDRYGNNPNDYRHARGPPSRPSDDRHHRGGFSGNRRPFDHSPPRYPIGSGGGGGGFRPMDGDGGFRPLGMRGGRNYNPSSEFEVPLSGPRFNSDFEVPLSGQKRPFDFPGRGGSPPDRYGGGGGGNYEKRNFDGDSYGNKRHAAADGGSYDRKPSEGGNVAKLFVGSVPKTATEDDIRPPFEEYGNVLEVALIKDKRTGQQQGCCFIKYATSEEADRAIRALHNQYTLPGGVGPIQVRYADGERERLGAVEYKLFVGSLNKQATEKEVEEIFLPFGRVEDVYLMRDEMKQSRGCGFVKYSNREAAMAAINALNGIYRMRGCDQPLIVRFADPKRPRPGETRGSPQLGGPGFGPRLPSPGIRPPNVGEAMQAPIPPNAWNPMNQQGMLPSDMSMHGKQPSAPSFNPSLPQFSSGGQNVSPLNKPNQSPQQFSSAMQPQAFSQAPASSNVRQPGAGQGQGQGQGQIQVQGQGQGQLQTPNAGGQTSFSQGFASQPMLGFNGMLPLQQAQGQGQAQAQAQAQAAVSSTTPPALSNNLPPHVLNAMMNQYQVPGQQQMMQPVQQSASPLAQMLSQQKQTLQASYQSSQQAFSQLQQQLQSMQPSNPNMTPQQNAQSARLQQSTWAGGVPQTSAASGAPTVKPVTDSLPATSVAPVMPPAKCNWTEHTSPDGYKYYYNSATGESKWEKPEELTLFELQQKPQEQQQPKQQVASMHQPISQTNIQSLPNQQTQMPQLQPQSHLQTQMQTQGRHPPQMQPANQPSAYQTTGVAGHQNMQGYGYAQMPVAGGAMNDPARFQQGMQGAPDWMWKNKTGPGS